MVETGLVTIIIVTTVCVTVVWQYMGVSENRGTLFWGPYTKDPPI